MDFRNVYAQGFARVAACTLPVALADPATNAERVLAQVRACHDEGVAVALFPELCLSGYAIDDLVMQDVLLDAVDEAVGRLERQIADGRGQQAPDRLDRLVGALERIRRRVPESHDALDGALHGRCGVRLQVEEHRRGGCARRSSSQASNAANGRNTNAGQTTSSKPWSR